MNKLKIILTGTLISTKSSEKIELDGHEKSSISNFLDGKSEKTVNLERVLGIGGEGIVLAEKMDTRENHYERGLEEKKGRDVAVKFVEFVKDEDFLGPDEDFLGPEKEDDTGLVGGITENGKWVLSDYFCRLRNLGDFKAATWFKGGYSRPYIDFGISEIHRKYYYVIGKLIF